MHKLFHDGAVHLSYLHAALVIAGVTFGNALTYLWGFFDCKRQYDDATNAYYASLEPQKGQATDSIGE